MGWEILFLCRVLNLVDKTEISNLLPLREFLIYSEKREEKKNMTNSALRPETVCRSQGHPTSIFGKYLFGRRFEI